MRRADFKYELPHELIAQRPAKRRVDARLLCLEGKTGGLTDRRFTDLPDLLNPGDLLVMNRSRVILARLFGRKPSGGRVEILVEKILTPARARVQLRVSKKPSVGAMLELDGGARAKIIARDSDRWTLEFTVPLTSYLEQHGHLPLPPYIERPDDVQDQSRYQTVYADRPGAIAAPTAGLHFDQPLLDQLRQKGVEQTFITLHVGAGTFQPLRTDDLAQHQMHAEHMIIDQAGCDAIAATRRSGGRIIAVGTTSVRALESAVNNDGVVSPGQQETTLFITPGFRFRVVDAMITNFHLPESTLLMLVSAFAGHHNTLQAYAHAVRERYRFFSYGDAMFITPADEI